MPVRTHRPAVASLLTLTALALGAGTGAAQTAVAKPAAPSDYSQRVVAYIYNSIPVTREELGEYLIARSGADKLELLINKKIIEHACHRRGIEVSAAEVEAGFMEDCKGVNVKRQDFIDNVLKQYGKTELEWKEDIIKVRLLLQKLCKDQIQVTDDDLKKQYESMYGAKVDVRMVMYPGRSADKEKLAMQQWQQARASEEEFDRVARSQELPALAATGGRVRPISHYAGVHPEIEKEAFSLKPGELSRLITTPDGIIMMKCVSHMPADTARTFESVKAQLHKEVFERKSSQEIPKVMKALRDEANPTVFLKKPGISFTELETDVRKELGMPAQGAVVPAGATKPAGQ